MVGILTSELAAALQRSDDDALVHTIDTIFRTGSAGARERIAPFLSAEALASPDGASHARRLLWTLFNRTRHFDDVVGPGADPAWLGALSPLAGHVTLFHLATLYLTPFRGAEAVTALLRMLDHLRVADVGRGGPTYSLVDTLLKRDDPRIAPALASLLGAPSADDWHLSYALRALDDPSTAAALRARQPKMRKKHRDFAGEVIAHLERDRGAAP